MFSTSYNLIRLLQQHVCSTHRFTPQEVTLEETPYAASNLTDLNGKRWFLHRMSEFSDRVKHFQAWRVFITSWDFLNCP